MLVPRKLTRGKLVILLSVLALAVGLGVYLLVVNLGSALPSLPTTTTDARFGGNLDSRLELPDPAKIADPALFDQVIAQELQNDGTLPLSPGLTHNTDPFAPLPSTQVKKR
jgi:hypothetical protein